jgi:enamine deaminase RidA (YjgF/YER057c/UK114 family)
MGTDNGMSVEERLSRLGLQLPAAPRPAGRYQPWIITNGLLFISGQIPLVDGALKYRGRVGAELTEDEGRDASRIAALNVLAQIDAALGGFERLITLTRVEGTVASAPDWFQQPRVLDGASDLFYEALGHCGDHTRAAFGAFSLPLNAPVELVVTAAVRP